MTRIAKASLLLFFFSLCGAAFFVTRHFGEQTSAPLPRELFAVVNQQLIALRAADFPSAYRHAAAGVQQKFTLQQFERMVRHNYPAIVGARRVEFGVVRLQARSAIVQVFFFGENDSVRSFVYSLVNEDDAWKIDGVEELQAPTPNKRLVGTHV